MFCMPGLPMSNRPIPSGVRLRACASQTVSTKHDDRDDQREAADRPVRSARYDKHSRNAPSAGRKMITLNSQVSSDVLVGEDRGSTSTRLCIVQ